MTTKRAIWLLIGSIMVSPIGFNGLDLVGWIILIYTTYRIYWSYDDTY